MNTYYLASPVETPLPPSQPRARHMIPAITLESLDGNIRIPLDGSAGWIRMPGSTGLEMPPLSTSAQAIPGVPGSVNTDVRVESRPVFLPIYCNGDSDQMIFRQRLDTLRRLVDPYVSRTFKIIGRSARGTRELIVTYEAGLEGSEAPDVSGLDWAKIGLVATANEPFARDREDRSLEFRLAEASTAFMGVVGGTDAPWPVSLGTGAVIGSGMGVVIGSEVPVYPTLELVGPMTSFTGTLSPVVTGPDGSVITLTDNQWSIDIPLGVPAGSTLKLVTDPRIRSVRLDNARAAGRVARGSVLRAFYPGHNVLDVSAPGGTDATRIRLSWRELHWSLW